MQSPLAGFKPFDNFGPRPAFTENGIHIPAMFHNGADIAAPSGTPIRAARSGVVTWQGWDTIGGGNGLIIGHGAQVATGYYHMLGAAVVRRGDHIKQGQVIGYVGMSGTATGPHLHFIVWENGREIDPYPLITASGNPVARKGLKAMAFYHREQREKRAIKKGQTLWMTHSSGANRGKKQNLVGITGNYVITMHLYGDGFAEGDSLEVILVWSKKGAKDSSHYIGRVQADRHGMIRYNPTFQRAVGSGYAVHAKVYASAHNKKTGTVSLLDSDATALG